MGYLGRVRPVETTASVLRSTYTGDGTTTTFNLPNNVSDETAIIATINGVVQQDAAYTTNGSQILFSAAPASGDAIELRVVSGVGLGYAPPDGSVVTGKLADGAVTNGKLGTGAAVANIGNRALGVNQMPAGTVLQVVQASYNTIGSTTSSSYVTTGLAAAITPTQSTSKVLITVHIPITSSNTSAQNSITLYRGSTNLAIAGGAQQGFGEVYSGAGSIQAFGSLCFLDSPATTSSTTYTVYYASTNGGTTQVFNNNMTGTLSLMEIAA